MSHSDAVVIGAGPAGLACATLLARNGASVTLLDEQPEPGGQIYRGIETVPADRRARLGVDYAHGASLAAAMRAAGVAYLPDSSVWQITPAREIWFSRSGRSRRITADILVLATGAMERPVPLPGWTLPGVLSAGAAQILLKTSGLVSRGMVLAGTGPLLYLLATQMIAAGAPPRALVDTAPPGARRAALTHLAAALRGAGASYLAKGFLLMAAVRRAGVPIHRHATDLRIESADDAAAVAAIAFHAGGRQHRIATRFVALHQGVIPAQQIPRALGCDMIWDEGQRCFAPITDGWGATSLDGILIAGDAAGISGASAAEHAGRVVGAAVLHRLGRIDTARRDAMSAADRRALARHRAVRPLLDALFPPPDAVRCPPDDVMICRCEEVTAGALRGAVAQGCLGPNQAKSFLRVGMGPCQGRICGPVVAEVIARERGVPVSEIGYFRIRPPLRPITVGELASADTAAAEA